MMSEFRDQVVLVTGATGGLGEIVTRQFLDAGAHIVAVAAHWPTPPESQRVHPLQVDLTDPAQCRQAVTTTIDMHGRVDVLLHLVGGFTGGASIAETSDETWYRMLGINLHSTFNLCREVLPHMVARRRGRIIAIGSKAGTEPTARLGAYHVSKSAMHSLVRVIAEEIRGTGVTANVILPSTIDTPGNRAAMPGEDHTRWVSPGVIAQLIAYLSSDAAADINGALIPIYGRA
jgi:NAD(P)-dependent dehydrogenase (short-subunit alcohol dehydrogenase family)